MKRRKENFGMHVMEKIIINGLGFIDECVLKVFYLFFVYTFCTNALKFFNSVPKKNF